MKTSINLAHNLNRPEKIPRVGELANAYHYFKNHIRQTVSPSQGEVIPLDFRPFPSFVSVVQHAATESGSRL